MCVRRDQAVNLRECLRRGGIEAYVRWGRLVLVWPDGVISEELDHAVVGFRDELVELVRGEPNVVRR